MNQPEYPPRLQGSLEEQIRQLWDYLYRLAERRRAEQDRS